MIHLKDMREALEQHLDQVSHASDAEILADLPNHIKMILVHLERMHRNIAVHIDTLG